MFLLASKTFIEFMFLNLLLRPRTKNNEIKIFANIICFALSARIENVAFIFLAQCYLVK